MAFNETMRRAFEPAAKNNLTATERHVLLELCNGASMRNAKLFPSHETIAVRCGYSRATVIRALKVLEERGWIQRERRRRKDGTRTTDLLTVRAPQAQATPDRLLPLMSVVRSTTPAAKVAPRNSDKVAQSNIGPGKQSRTVQQQNPISKNLKLHGGSAAAGGGDVDKRAITDPAVCSGLDDLVRQMKERAAATPPPLAQRGLARRAG